MKSFSEFRQEQRQLNESTVRRGSVTTFAVRSAEAGNKAESAYRKGLLALADATKSEDLSKRLDRLEAAISALLQGHMYQRQQISSHVALDVAGHFADQKKRRRAG